jgi:hypothetical protein
MLVNHKQHGRHGNGSQGDQASTFIAEGIESRDKEENLLLSGAMLFKSGDSGMSSINGKVGFSPTGWEAMALIGQRHGFGNKKVNSNNISRTEHCI